MTRGTGTQRYCVRCGSRLSSYNGETRCAACEVAARDDVHQPPAVAPAFWQTDQMRDALSTWHMGRVIYAYRVHPYQGRPLPQELVAGWLGLTQAQLSRIEKGTAPEQLSKLIHWAQTLRIPVDLLWFKLPDEPEPETAPVAHDGEADVQLARWLLSGGSGEPPQLGQTDELQRIGQALDDSWRYFDGSVVAFFEQQLATCKANDGSRGSTAALPLSLGVLAAVRRHVQDVKSTLRQPLLSLGAEGAEFVGWLYRDRRHSVAAGYWYDRAMEMAQAAGDLSMQGYLLLRKSQMAYEDRDSLIVATLADAARHGPWELPRSIQAEATQQQARGLAMMGESFSVVERKLDEARTLMDAGPGDVAVNFSATYDEHTHLLRSASCYMEAGKPAKAARLFDIALKSGSLSDRDEGYFRARHAVALALSGEPDTAADEGLVAMRCATEKRSARTTKELIRAVEALGRWQHRPQPKALRDALRASVPK